MSFHYPSVIQRFILFFYLQCRSVLWNPQLHICCFLAFLGLTTATWAQTPDANGILYVKKGSSGTGDSWGNAMGELGNAIQVATLLNTGTSETVKQIWVSGGTYYPMYTVDGSGDNRAKTFKLPTDVKIYGGFAGTEMSVSNRDLTNIANSTILSGDLGTTNDASDNAYHVVLGVNTVGGAELNGFTITGGNANNAITLTVSTINVYCYYGGGLYLTNAASPLLSNLIITNNNASNLGGGIFCIYSSSPVLSNVVIDSNSSSNGGGMANYSDSSPSLTSVTFTNNNADVGGAIYIFLNSTPSLTNVAFNSNNATSFGGAIYGGNNGGVNANKVQFRGNSSGTNGGGIFAGAGTWSFRDVLFSGNKATGIGGAVYANGSSVSMINSTIAGNNATTAGAVYGDNTSSLAIYNSVVYGNSSGITTLGTLTNEYSLIQGITANSGTHMLDGATNPQFILAPSFATAPFATGNYQVILGSPLVNAGKNALYPGLNVTSNDLAGNSRITHHADGSFIDIGAYENTGSIAQTISASNTIKTYGDIDFEPGATTSSGLVVSYSSSNTSVALPYQDATDGNKWKIRIVAAGTVTITGSQLGNNTYDVAPEVTFTLTINKAPLTIIANNDTRAYNGSGYTGGNGVTFSGFVNGDTTTNLSGSLFYTGTSQGAITMGNYVITPNGYTSTNYNITYQSATLAITKAPITIVANSQSKVYGTSDPLLTYIASGFVGSDNSSILTGSLSRNTGENAGSYTINQNTLSVTNNNYTIAYTSNTLTITKATLQIVADVQSKVYGEADPVFTYTTSGFVSGDDASILTGTLSRVTGENVGTYTITQGGLSAGNNYSISLTDNSLTITQASLLITADAQSKVYGTADPALTFIVSGFKNGDNNSVLSGSLNRDSGENAGVYAINQNTLSAGANYIITYTGNVLTITKAPQFITWQQDLTVGCDGSAAPMQLTAITNSGLPVNYIITNTNIATINGDILTPVHEGSTIVTVTQPGDANHFPAEPIENNFTYQLFGRVRQHWNDVIFFDNTGGNYVSWQWYKNGAAVAGATEDFYNESSTLNGSYYVLATDNNGNTVQSCALVLTGSSTVASGIKVYPNPSRPGETVTITCNYTNTALQGAKLIITNLVGNVAQQITSVKQENQVTMPLVSGMYIVTLILNDGQKATVNVIVN
ncbi:MBG domain-containing protein [Xanthocytophaga agilis]|uniref:MBG domain-containing protein n=1 Tax=Xanthocytophaga agilis TaxID=3048010 RepID=A0AAE3QY20_9BACT|nr:MBG domain-containing protein [Xanthocytophaga agilis]MDJ1499580.1 MBG domain-containing protein [Xanthocytophaga agilis]